MRCLPEYQVGSGWLNPTEEAVWPLAETLAVAQLAFQGLDATQEERGTDGEGKRVSLLFCAPLGFVVETGVVFGPVKPKTNASRPAHDAECLRWSAEVAC